MTWDDAYGIAETNFRFNRPSQEWVFDAKGLVEVLEALGVLKLDGGTGRTATHHFARAADAIRPLVDCPPSRIIEAIEAAGLKIVES